MGSYNNRIIARTTPDTLCATGQGHSATCTASLKAVKVTIRDGIRVDRPSIRCTRKYTGREVKHDCVRRLVRRLNNIRAGGVTENLSTTEGIYVGDTID